MRALFGTILIYLVIKAFLLVMGLGIGLLMHWLAPSIDIGIGILIGIVATGLTIHFYARLFGLRAVPSDVCASIAWR